jgi:hypothetical protein
MAIKIKAMSVHREIDALNILFIYHQLLIIARAVADFPCA